MQNMWTILEQFYFVIFRGGWEAGKEPNKEIESYCKNDEEKNQETIF